MTLSAIIGKVTSMRFRRLSPENREFRKKWKELEELPDMMGIPKQWSYCPHCGTWCWRHPPHGQNTPCPFLVDAAQAVGLKTDAERMTALRTGAQMEQVSKMLAKFMTDIGGETDE